MTQLEKWPKHKSGIREVYKNQPCISNLIVKFEALHSLVRLNGVKTGNLWDQKVPSKKVKKIEQEVKLKISLADKPPELFPNNKHPSGCSLQYLIMIAEILGAPNWYEQYINRYDEAIDTTNNLISKEKIEEILCQNQ